MPGIHFRLRMTDSEIAEVTVREVHELVSRLVPEVFETPRGDVGHTAGQAQALAELHLLTYFQQAVEQLEARAANEAAGAGAGYPQIGRASKMTRQGARRRWPGLLDQQPSSTPPETGSTQ
ncbi:hypothetical protein E2C11_13215 [Streptomyces lavendulae]|nr:hypothetical protein [Streptomyces lavendulae]TXJ79180.1 hypothetical protein E2C11_13215 [Streptomyces lavendulae]